MRDSGPTAIISFAGPDGQVRTRAFARPLGTIVARRLDEVRPALREVARAAEQGLYAAGFVSYEAAPAFDPAFRVVQSAELPLLWFGLFDRPLASPPPAGALPGPLAGLRWRPDIDRARYNADIARIRATIAAGDVYQVNHTLRFQASFEGDSLALFRQLHAAHPAPYSAFLDIDRFQVLSLSPELFFERRDRRIVTRPMKGTAPRGRWPAEDDQRAAWLAGSEKNRAENLMIVDLLRNDLGRIAVTGSVRVPQMFTVERYPTVLQLTSTVTALERPGATLEDVFAALFPCGSVTGAPKISAMRMIAALEAAPRAAYCGAVGLVEPGGAATFNVAIRTLLVDQAAASATYGAGGGITWDSTADDEYQEVLAKAALLGAAWPRFDLLETLRLKRGRYAMLAGHLRRLAESAHFFDIPLDLGAVKAALARVAASADNTACRVRLLVAPDGGARAEAAPLVPLPAGPQPVGLARSHVSRHDRFLFHKTTNRAVYQARRSERPELFDVLLWNEDGELTEFTIGNLVVRLDGRLWTPPRDSGLLAGVLREALLRRGTIAERRLTPDDLARAEQAWMINSVRGWVEVRFEASSGHR